jgi:PAS domain S-box-containing protein
MSKVAKAKKHVLHISEGKEEKKDDFEIVKILREEEKLGRLKRESRRGREERPEDIETSGVFPEETSVFMEEERVKTRSYEITTDELYRNIVELCPDGIVVIDRKGVIISYNTAAAEMMGYGKKELVGKYFADVGFSSSEDIRRFARMFRSQVLKGKIVDKLEVELRRKDGTCFLAEVNSSLLRKNGRVIGIQAIFRDITDRKKAEERLRESERRFRDISYSMADWIWEVDRDWRYTFASGKVKEILGYKPEELIGKTIFEFMPEEESKRVEKVLKKIVSEKGSIADLESWGLTRRGKKICFLINGVPLLEENGELIGYRGVNKDITRRKRMEEELVESRGHFQKLFDAIIDPVVVVDSRGKFLRINDAVEKVTGFKKEELLGRNFLRTSIVTGKSKMILVKNLIKRMAGHEIKPYEIEVLTKDGRKLAFEVNAAKIDYMGQPADMVIFRDVSERRNAERRLRESEERFKQLYEKAPVAYHTLSPTGIITDVNEKWCRTLGYDKEEVLGRSIFDFIDEKEREAAVSSFKQKILSKETYTGGSEITFVTKEGAKRIFLMHDFLSFNKEGVCDVHTTMEDITEQRRVLDELIKSEEKYRVLTETSADGIFTTDELGRLTYVNPSLEKLLGRSKSKILGTPFRNYISGRSVYLFQQLILDARKEDKKIENVELSVIHGDGYEVPVQINISPLKKNGCFIGVECTARDISEQRKVLRELKKSEKLRTEFMNIVAHELKSPVTPIKGYLELIEADKDASERVRNWARIALRNSERLLRLVNDILDVARLDSDTMRFEMEKIDLTKILLDAGEDIRPAVENKKLKFVMDIPDDLPQILGDKHRLSQVFKNLLENAIKFTDYGTITLQAEKKNKDLFIYVEDTGVGISKPELKKIFSKFYQAYTGEDRKIEGTGLGLFITKEIIKKHRGDVWAESEVGKGSKFIIKLPIK